MTSIRKEQVAIALVASGLVIGMALAPGLAFRSAYAQMRVSEEEASDGLAIVVRFIKDQIADYVEEVAEDSNDEDLEDQVTDVAEEVSDDDDGRDELEEALDEAVNGTIGANETEIASITTDELAEAAVMEAVVNELAENNSGVMEDAVSEVSDAMVESLTDPSADIRDLLDDSTDEITSIIENGISESEVEQVLEDLDENDVIDAIEDGDIDLQDEVLVVSDTFTIFGEFESNQSETPVDPFI